MTSTSAPPNNNFIGYTNVMKLTNSMSLSSGYTVLFTFSPPVAGYYSLQGQIAYQWVVGTANWNTFVDGISTSITSYDSEILNVITVFLKETLESAVMLVQIL